MSIQTGYRSMSANEVAWAIAAAALAVFSIFVASKATDPGYAFHAYVFAFAGLAAVFAIGKRAAANVTADAPQEIGC